MRKGRCDGKDGKGGKKIKWNLKFQFLQVKLHTFSDLKNTKKKTVKY
jgi:hypothetical protein